MVLSSPAPCTRVMLLAAGLSCGLLSLICTSYGKGDQTRPSVDGRAVLCSALRCAAELACWCRAAVADSDGSGGRVGSAGPDDAKSRR